MRALSRRDVLIGFGALGLLGCEAGTRELTREPNPADGGVEGIDVNPADAGEPIDAGTADVPIVETLVITEAFGVVLNDPSCSGHSHSLYVQPASFETDTPVHFLGGSHELVFLPSELVRLQRGEELPFATIGDGPGHGHCGTAWRASLGDADPTRVDVCEPIGTAECIR